MASDKVQSIDLLKDSKMVIPIKRLSVLKSAKTHLKILGCLPLPIDQQNWPDRLRKIPINKIQICFIYLILILNLLSTCWFYISEVDTFIDFLESVFWVSRSILSLALYTMFIWHKSDFIKLFNDLEDIVHKRRQNNYSSEVYEKTNQNSKIIPRNILIFIFVCVVLYATPIVYKSYHAYFTSNCSANAFLLFYHISLPFNWKSVVGYVFVTALELLFFLGVLETFVTFLVIYLGICQFCIAFVTDIKDRFGDFKYRAELCHGNFSMAEKSELSTNLREIVKFHSQVIQFVIAFAKFYKKFIAMFFLISTLYLSIFFLRIHYDLCTGDLINISRSIIRMPGWIIGFCYICNFGDQVSESFQEIAYCIYEIPWFEMPLKIIKYFPTMMAVAQRSIYFYGCFNIRCIRVTYRKIMYAAFTYFMVLREII